MATYSASCSKVGSFSYASNFTLYVVLTERDVSVANNTSYVDYNVYCRSSGSGSLQSNHYEKFVINGQSIKDETVYVNVSSPNANIAIASGSIGPITHNADGSKTISFNAQIQATAYGVSASLSDNFTLTTIPRTSNISLSSSSVTLGNAVTINTNRASSSFTHKLYYQIDNGSWNLIASNVGASYSWTTPLSIANSIPNATSKTITIIGETYNGSTYIGSSTTSLSVSVPSSVVPTISSFSLSGSISGTWVETLCNVTASSAGSGAYSSTITSYKVEMLKGSSVLKTAYGSSVTFDTNNLNISANTDITLRLTITDSRSRTATRSTTINVKKYTKPVITSRSAYRCNSSGTRDENGTYIKIAWAYSTTSISGVTSDTAQVKYRKSGTSSWTNVSVPNGGSTIVSGISTDSAYEVNYSLSDSRNSVSTTDTIPTGYVTVDYRSGGKGIAFGKVSEADTFECNMIGDFKKDITWNASSASNVNYNDYKKSGTYYMGSGCTNAPAGLSWMRMIVIGSGSSGDIVQIASSVGDIPRTFVRSCSNSSWHYWREIPLDLYGQRDDNINNFSQTCFVYTSNTANTPVAINGYVRTFFASSNYIIQEYVPYNASGKWIRAKQGGTWGAWKCISHNIYTASLSARIDITSAGWTHTKIALNQASADYSGGLLSLNSNGIKIGKGVSAIKVSARIGYYSYAATGEVDLEIYKNSTCVKKAYGSCKVGSQIEELVMNSVPLSVAEGDIIYLYICKGNNATMTLLTENDSTNLTVEVIQ